MLPFTINNVTIYDVKVFPPNFGWPGPGAWEVQAHPGAPPPQDARAFHLLFAKDQNFVTFEKYRDIIFCRSPSIKSTGSNLSHLANSLRASMRYKVSYASAILIHHREEGRAATVTILGMNRKIIKM